ncbi:MAG: sigma 54-interacting transcriptional regulator [Thermoanaerobacteraceae bacterium]|nr:sigma 54-interacting transcriptional regulator [Thermoanaerobacteraceae bacterium]
MDLGEVLDNLDEGVQIIDRDGRIIYINQVLIDMEGLDREEVLGKHLLEVYPSLKENESTLLQVLKTGQPVLNIQQSFINYKGRKITTVNSSYPLLSTGGAVEVSQDITRIKNLSERILELEARLYHKGRGRTVEGAEFTLDDIIGVSREINDVKEKAVKIAKTSSSVLVYGETGTGKEMFIQAIHNLSPRKNGPFIAQNCAALPSNLLESILFGTVKGSFTGADDRPGLFEVADGGTLLLDEINAMPLELQVKLLRVLQDGAVRRVGSVKLTRTDVRIMASMNENPESVLKEGRMRRDLFYRLNTVTLYIPPLRERREDILYIARFYIDKLNRSWGTNVKGLAPEVEDFFLTYSWPGNVRELMHVIEGSMNLMNGDYITISDLPPYFKVNEDSGLASLDERLASEEKRIIREALDTAGGNISRAARLLKIPRQTLQNKIKKYSMK